MFVQITLINIRVALMCFFGGILFSLGTHVILFNNAIMVGVFQYFFKMKGLLLTSFLTIWIHGAFEISRSEEHTSELQSRPHLVCRLLLEKKKKSPHTF